MDEMDDYTKEQYEKGHLTEGRGRSAKKREAQRVESLAKRVIELSQQLCERMGLSDYVLEEIATARDTEGRGSSKRQLKYLAGVLREVPESIDKIDAFLDGYDQVQYTEKKAFHKLEEYRDRLCAEATHEQALSELSKEMSPADLKPIRGLARSVIKSGDKKASREIFKKLRESLGK